ncbi:hypothetical protein BAE44_0014733, partial [Dichanthelium oligosanthes]
LCVTVFCFVVLLSCVWLQIFPLWAESDRSYGGLGLLSEDVGQVFALTVTCINAGFHGCISANMLSSFQGLLHGRFLTM